MKIKTVVFETALAEISAEDHFHHPGQRIAKFIFCDDRPNENQQGVEHADFAEVTRSAIGSPVKMKFLGQTVGGHSGSVPIGFIHGMEEVEAADGSHQLVASATLFATEFPEEIEHLEESFAEGKAPGISWEIIYKDSIIRDGVEWLKGIITRAATFVKVPAYGSRTALLALASNNKELSDEDLSTELSALANEFSPKNTNKGGNNNVEEELRKAKEELQAALDKIAALETSTAELTTANAALQTSVDEATTALSAKEDELKAVAERELVAERTRVITEAGIKIEADAEKLAKKQAF